MWVDEYRGRRSHQLDPKTGAVLLRLIASDRLVTGVSWPEGEFWHDTGEGELRRIDPDSGTVLENLSMPSGVGVSGLESYGGDHFFCGGASGTLRTVRRPERVK